MSISSDSFLIDAPVRRVTLFEDRAQVERQGRSQLSAGRCRVLIKDVAPVLVDRTLSFEGVSSEDGNSEGTVKVRDLRVYRDYRPVSERPGGDLTDEARELKRLERELQGRRELLGEQRRMMVEIADRELADMVTDASWNTPDPDAWSSRLQQLEARQEAMVEQEMEIKRDARVLQEKTQDLEDRRDQLENPSLRLAADIEVILDVEHAGEYRLKLEYVVPSACWRPAHRAWLRTDKDRATVAFTTEACVWQKTGEDWSEVELCMSTRRASRGHRPPLLHEDLLIAQDKPEQVELEAREVDIEDTGHGSTRTASSEVPGIDDAGEVLFLQSPHIASIPTDGRPYRVPLSSFDADAEIQWTTIPELVPAVVRKVMLVHGGGAPILAGPVELIADSGPIGRTKIHYVAREERFELSFGTDPSIRIQRQIEKVDVEPSLLSRFVERKHSVTLKLSNIGTEPRDFEVVERIPVSEVEQARVKLHLKGTIPAAEPDSDGMIKRRVHLAGGAGETLKLSYSVEKKKDVI